MPEPGLGFFFPQEWCAVVTYDSRYRTHKNADFKNIIEQLLLPDDSSVFTHIIILPDPLCLDAGCWKYKIDYKKPTKFSLNMLIEYQAMLWS